MVQKSEKAEALSTLNKIPVTERSHLDNAVLFSRHGEVGNAAIELLAMRDRLARLEAATAKAREALEWLSDWAKAYPVDIFPEPDLKKAHELLKTGGMTLDAVSASNFRFMLSRINERVNAALAELEK
jgi:hypothetical protein